jgi:hypothetical protein
MMGLSAWGLIVALFVGSMEVESPGVIRSSVVAAAAVTYAVQTDLLGKLRAAVAR